MNINIPAENKKIQNIKLESKNKTKFEKIRKILNNPVTKFCGGLLGSSTLFGATGFLIYLYNKNKSKKTIDHQEYKERIVNGVKISVAVQEWISKNIFLIEWENGSCWNDTFTQLLMSPEIRCKECKSSKINKLFNWINDKLNEPYNGDYLKRKIKIEDDIRVLPDNFEKSIDIPVNPIHVSELLLENFKFDDINFNDLNILNLIDVSYVGAVFKKISII